MPHRLVCIAQDIQALNLSSQEDLEQHRVRSVVNRAYYAAYLTAKSFCDQKGFEGSGSSHERVVNALRSRTEWRKQANQLQQVKEMRHKADYKWHMPMTDRDAKQCLKKSREIIGALKSS